MRAPAHTIYEAVVALSRLIAGRSDLDALVSGLGEALRLVVRFDHLGLVLHEPAQDAMQGYILNTPGNPEMKRLRLPVDEDPTGWVWLNQKPLIIRRLESETRWPNFINRARAEFGISTFVAVPLTAGDNRLGAFAFSSVTPLDITETEITFLERVADEFAVTVDAFLSKQRLVEERDRLRTLFDITNALVSKLPPQELFNAISEQLGKITKHDFAIITLCNDEAGGLDVYARHFNGPAFFEHHEKRVSACGMPAAEALATGRPVVVRAADFERYPSFRRYVDLGCQTGVSIPLKTSNRTVGTLEVAKTTDENWTGDDVEFLVQVANQIAIALENSLAYRQLSEMKDRLATEKLYLEDEIRLDHNIGNMVGEGIAFQSILKSVQIVAPTDSTVLILGETGTGKELVARAIHELSNRRKGSFVKVNCAAIPASLLESELFGHEKGAFTGAVAQKVGRFELAHQGTLFLDEIGELPLELQPKLLRAIQDQEFERVGGSRTIRPDVRFVAATNRDLKAMADDNKFRADLYYRLHVFPLSVPTLRERREDIPLLTRYFVEKHAQRMGRKIDAIPTAALEALVRYEWPGNIRELQNVLERSVILTAGSTLQVAMPDLANMAGSGALQGTSLSGMDAVQRERIVKALVAAKGQVGGPDGAAARLGLKRTTLQSRMRKYNIEREYR